MLGLLGAWLIFPAVALLVCAGVGLLVERAAGARVPGALLLPVGMAGVVAVSQLPTYLDATAELTVPLVVLAAAAGLWLGRAELRDRRPQRWPTLLFFAVLALYGAPVLLTGAPSFLGYTVLGDTSIHMIGSDALLRLGRDFDSLEPSSYEYSLVAYYGANGYPSGGPTAIGALTSLVHMDVAWTFQPFLSLLAAFMGLGLYSLARPLVPARPLRALVAFLAATPAMAVAYAWQGSVKETGTAYAVVLVAALIPPYLAERDGPPRRAVPLAVVVAAAVGIVGPAAGVWLGPLALGAFLLARVPWRHALLFVPVVLVLSYQMVIDLFTYVEVSGGVVTAQEEFGNLLGELDRLQALGIWLTGDYRRPVTDWETVNGVLLVVVGLAVLAGIAHTLRRRAWSLALFLLVSGAAFAFIVHRGSPWADGKAIMIVSPAVMLAAGVGALWLGRAGYLVLAVIAAGVLWSNALQFHDASPAPNDRFSELQQVGERIGGKGPTLYPEFEEFAKHFLRDGDPEGTGEGWQRRFTLSPGDFRRFGFATDLDSYNTEYLGYYRTIVLRKGYQSSRPPSNYERTYDGDFYEVWTQTDAPQPVARLAVGGDRAPAGPVDCAALEPLLANGPALAYAERPPDVVFDPAYRTLPGGWFIDQIDTRIVVPRGAGTIRGTVTVRQAGRYDVFLEVSDRRVWEVVVGGQRLTFPGRLNSRGVAERLGTIDLPAGAHAVSIERPRGSLAPGSGGHDRLLGPLALTPADRGGIPVATAPSDDPPCGRNVDWVDVLSGSLR